MEYNIEKKAKSTVELTITVKGEEWVNIINDTYNKTKGKYFVEGFRKGKVPRSVIERMYGREVFLEDATDIALKKFYAEVLDKEKLEVVSAPNLDVKTINLDEFSAVITFAVRPEVKLGDYKGNKIEKTKVEVTDKQVEDAIVKEQEKLSRLIDVEGRAAQDKDTVTIDYSGSVDGVKFEGGTAEKQQLIIGSNSFIPGFEAQVIGMNIGEDKDIKVTFPADYHAAELAGKEAVFVIHLHSIQVKELPAIDDEFAKDVSEFDTLDAYKADVSAKLLETAEKQGKFQDESKLIDAIVDKTEVEIPDQMIEDEIDYELKGLEQQMSMYGIKFDDYLKYTGTTKEQIREDKKEEATKRLKTNLTVEAILEKEKIEVSMEDVENAVKKHADEEKTTVEEVKKQMDQNSLNQLYSGLIIEKLVAFLRENNTIE